MTTTLPPIQYTARDFDAIVEFLQGVVESQNPDMWSDFFESNIGVNIIDMIAVQGDILSFVANQISREMFLPTCQRYASALKHAKLVGYKPRARTAASLTIQAKLPLPTELQTQSMRFLADQEVQVGDLTFQLPAEVIFPPHRAWGTNTSVVVDKLIDSTATFIADGRVPGEYVLNNATGTRTRIDTVDSEIQLTLDDDRFTAVGEGYLIRGDAFELTVSHSEAQEDQFISDGSTYQSFTTTEAPTIDASWTVLVNSFEWTETDSLLLAQATYVYEATLTSTGALNIRFGDGVSGLIPPASAIIDVDYRTGGGVEGNVLSGASNGTQIIGYISTTSHRVTFNNDDAATGGADEETLDELKFNIPAWVRTVDKAVTQEDYNTLSRTFEDPVYGAVARATAKLRYVTPSGPPLSGPYGNYIDVFIWAYSLDDSFEAPSLGLKQALHAYLKDRRVVTVQVCVQDGVNVVLDVDMGVIIVDSRFALDAVEDNIDAAVAEFFTDAAFQPGQSFRISDYYRKIDGTAGVDHFQMVSPTADVAVLDTELVVRGTITYTLEYPAGQAPTTGPCP